ncbi:GLPGLI family protein [Elizabethkingia meningoseptica]|uniref:GLPGLI family protein n=1 Tax=Elizabethkingia meningoseptica TaxID=238 RepID=UPI0023B047D5|nr:GLPGLI family protein [Elizabethkingia meningoseptica]MDE5492953.1 GLPGLI family protein [Elizabethkingia meningoseptica]
MKIIYILTIVLISVQLSAQKKSFVYHLKYNDGTGKDPVERNYILDISDNKSIFRSVSERKSDSLLSNGKFGFGSSYCFEEQFYINKDLKQHEILKQVRNFFGRYLIKIDEKLNWKISPENSKIGNYIVQKAETEYGGRHWIAWFTTEIPIPDGPYIFNGLPGLIIQISDDKSDYNFSLSEVKNFDGNLFQMKKGIVMDFPTFQKFSMNYYNDPFAEAAARNIPMGKADENGNPVRASKKEMNEMAQKHIREKGNNPIELSYMNKYN